MTIEAFKIIFQTCEVLNLIVLALCLYRLFSRSREVQLLALIYLSSSVTFIVANQLSGFARNAPQNYWIMLNGIAVILIYDAAWNRRYKMVSVASLLVFVSFALWNIIWGQRNLFNSYTIAFGSLIFVANSLLYFYHLLIKLPVQKLGELPMFWFNAAFLFYYAGSLFIFAAYVVEVFRNSLLLYWGIQNILRIFQFMLIMVGLYFDLRRLRSPAT